MKVATKTRRYETWTQGERRNPYRRRRYHRHAPAPLVEGGQGRSGGSVASDGRLVGWCLVAGMVLVVLALVGVS